MLHRTELDFLRPVCTIARMPTISHSMPKNKIDRGRIKVSQDGAVLSPPGTIAFSCTPSSIAAIARLPDENGRAVFDIQANNEGPATVEIGSGAGKLTVNLTVGPPEAGPLVFELDGVFQRQN